jgi:hypothetical protein
MPRKRDTLERRNRRFLLPFLNLSAPALMAIFFGAKIPELLCGSFLRLTPAARCDYSLPPIFFYAFFVLFLAGVCGSAWRFYKDYVCHERFDGFY